MKINQIKNALNLVKTANQNAAANGDLPVVLLIRGDAGLGKSSGVKDWVKEQRVANPNFFYKDRRVATMEPMDFQGLPIHKTLPNGDTITSFARPEFFPGEDVTEGVLFLDEMNRGKSEIQNALMSLCTEWEVNGHKLPRGVLIVAAVNPDNGQYDVNQLETALADRVIAVDVEYDHNSFVDYMKAKQFSPLVQSYFALPELWRYKSPGEIENPKDKYISPRTIEYVNTIMSAGAEKDPELLRAIALSTLGESHGKAFYAHVNDQRPILAEDFKKDANAAFKRLERVSNTDSFRGDLISTLVESLGGAYEGNGRGKKINDKLIRKVCEVLPIEYAVQLMGKIHKTEEENNKVENWTSDFKAGDVEWYVTHINKRLTADGVELDKIFPDEYPTTDTTTSK